MAETIISLADIRKELIVRYGECAEEHPYSDGEGHTRCVFIFNEAQVIAFFNGKENVAPIEYKWIKSCEVVETTEYIEKKTEEKNTPYLGNAIVGALLGMFVFSSKKKVTVERIPVTSYWLRLHLQNAPVTESVALFGTDYTKMSEIKEIVDEIVNRNSASSKATESDPLVKVREKDYPISFWIYLDQEYFNKARVDGYVYIPKSVLEEAKLAQKEQIEENRRIAETADINNQGIECEKAGDIDKAIELYELNVSKNSVGRHSYDRLLVLYHKIGKNDEELRICKIAVERFPEDAKYRARLDKLEGKTAQVSLPVQALRYTPTILWGEKYFIELRKLREFDFYSKGYDNKSYYESYVSRNQLSSIRSVVDHFNVLRENAENAETSGNLATAAAIYEQMIAEKCYMNKPYDRLIKIYSKAKLKSEEQRVLEFAIETLQHYKTVQLEYIRGLAKKYNAVDFCENYISNGKSIYYFMAGGGYIIYDSYKIIEKWQERLDKLKN